MTTTAKIMEQMGFSATDTGPYVTELRALVAQQVAAGLTGASYGSWVEGVPLTAEDRAKARLGMEWELRHRHSYRVEMLDRVVYWSLDCRTKKRRLVIQWRDIPAWLGDRVREVVMLARIFWDRRILKLSNPYN